MSFLSWVLSHKILLLFITATVAFGVSTIVLAVDNANLKSEDSTESPGKTTTTTTTTTPAPDMAKYRLPGNVKDLVYDLFLFPDLSTGNFTGKVSIDLTVTSPSNNIVMHSKGLSVDAVQVDGTAALAELDSEYELLTISKKTGSFEAVPTKIDIDFSGDMKNRIVGLYYSTYTTSSGVKRPIATSKFEPTFARQAFPCFDEPNLKSSYKVHLLKPKDPDYIALSNFPEVDKTFYDDKHEIVNFEQTNKKMSTYLACFIVSDFKSQDTVFNNLEGKLVPFRVFASPEQLVKTTYAKTTGVKIMNYYVQYFGLDYPLPKLDMVAIPDFVSGAMEHWGLVTYRETALLYSPTTHSNTNKQRVASVIAHELAHSWFGNLVTMNWWNDLWLNEGFASYIQFKGTAVAEPSWNMMDQFLTSELHPVLSLDATLASHPIIQKVETPVQITEVFDTISYNKGASILRMLEATIGEDKFKEGVKDYLQSYSYGNTITDNFWEKIQSQVTKELEVDVKSFMDTFTVQMGYPVVNVVEENGQYKLTQKRFLKDDSAVFNKEETPYKYKWNIPLTYLTNAGEAPEVIFFKHNEDTKFIPKPKDATWIKFNNQQIGYYRVNYEESHWNQLIDSYSKFGVSDKTHLLEEAFSLAEAGQLNYEIPLELTKKLDLEEDYVVWSVAYNVLDDLKGHLGSSAQEQTFKTYVAKLVNPAYEKLGWTDDDAEEHLKNLARVVVLSLACSVEHTECLNKAKELFNNWITKEPAENLSQNLRGLIYKYGMRSANLETWDKLFQRFAKESDANEKLKLMNGLANVQDPTLIKKLINLAQDETYVRSQDYFTLLQYISLNPIGTPIVWDYVRENWPTISDRFGLDDRYLGRLIPQITSSFASSTKLEEMKTFFEKYPKAGAGVAARAQALEAVQNNIIWAQKYKKIVEDWLAKSF